MMAAIACAVVAEPDLSTPRGQSLRTILYGP
jgi:hypothetical protein